MSSAHSTTIGRPRRGKYVKVSFTVSGSDLERLQREGQRLGLNRSATVEHILRAYYDRDDGARMVEIRSKINRIKKILEER